MSRHERTPQELIEEFSWFLSLADYGRIDSGRKSLTPVEVEMRVRLEFFSHNDEDGDNSEQWGVWVNHNDLLHLIEFVESGQLGLDINPIETALLIKDLSRTEIWLKNYASFTTTERGVSND